MVPVTLVISQATGAVRVFSANNLHFCPGFLKQLQNSFQAIKMFSATSVLDRETLSARASDVKSY